MSGPTETGENKIKIKTIVGLRQILVTERKMKTGSLLIIVNDEK